MKSKKRPCGASFQAVSCWNDRTALLDKGLPAYPSITARIWNVAEAAFTGGLLGCANIINVKAAFSFRIMEGNVSLPVHFEAMERGNLKFAVGELGRSPAF